MVSIALLVSSLRAALMCPSRGLAGLTRKRTQRQLQCYHWLRGPSSQVATGPLARLSVDASERSPCNTGAFLVLTVQVNAPNKLNVTHH